MVFKDCRVCNELADLRARSMAATEKAFLERMELADILQERLEQLDEELRQTIAARRYVEAAMQAHSSQAHS